MPNYIPRDILRHFKTFCDVLGQKKTRETPILQPEQQTGLKTQTTRTIEGVQLKPHHSSHAPNICAVFFISHLCATI